jgi:hypothetical protein
MRKATFRREFHTALRRQGFRTTETGDVFIESAEVRAICSAGTSRKSGITSVSLGFWLTQFATNNPPNVHWHCHIYGSLGTMLPLFGNMVLSVSRDEEAAMEAIIGRSMEIAEQIGQLLSVKALVAGYKQGRFSQAMILKDAREFLKSV